MLRHRSCCWRFRPGLSASREFSGVDTIPAMWQILGLLTVALIVGAYGVNSLILIGAITHCGWTRKGLAMIGLPACWVLAAVIGVGLFPTIVGLLWIMIDSLRS